MMAMTSQVYTYVRTQDILCFTYVQFGECQLSLNEMITVVVVGNGMKS